MGSMNPDLIKHWRLDLRLMCIGGVSVPLRRIDLWIAFRPFFWQWSAERVGDAVTLVYCVAIGPVAISVTEQLSQPREVSDA